MSQFDDGFANQIKEVRFHIEAVRSSVGDIRAWRIREDSTSIDYLVQKTFGPGFSPDEEELEVTIKRVPREE